MPRVKKPKIEESVEPKNEEVADASQEVSAASPVEPQSTENPNVKIVELNGKKYNQIFNPLEGTTRLELLE